VHIRRITTKYRSEKRGIGGKRMSGTTNLTILSTLRRRSHRPYYNAAQAGFGSPLGDSLAILLASFTRGTRTITSLRRPINFFYYFLDRRFSSFSSSTLPWFRDGLSPPTSRRPLLKWIYYEISIKKSFILSAHLYHRKVIIDCLKQDSLNWTDYAQIVV